MALTFSSTPSNSKPFEIAPEGPTVARCYRVIDLGTQVTTWQGETKQTPQLALFFELPNELTTEGKPKIITSIYTCSLGEKSKLRPVVSALVGKNLPDWFEEFDLKEILGRVAIVDVIHKPRKDGGVSAYISSVGKLLKGTAVPEPHNEAVFFDLGRFDLDIFNKLPKYYQEKIADSPEYKIAMAKLDKGPKLPTEDDIPF